MADSLVLKGVKDVRKHTGDEMMLVHPKRGGNTHQIKEWWRKSVNTTYTGCTIFNVTTGNGTVKLVLATGGAYIEDCDIRIDHDGSFNFSFYNINEIQRAALFTEDMQLIEHYLFPSIAGGSIVTVTPPNAASRPGAAPPAPSPSPSPSPSPAPSPDPTPEPAPEPTFAEKVAAADYSYVVTVANGVYELDGVAQQAIAGSPNETFHFDLSDASLSGHPLKIYTDETKTTEVTVGIEQEGTDLLFTPPIVGTFSYQCQNHAAMGGDITVS